jgi:hypothetical protein
MNFKTEAASIQEALRVIGRLAAPDSGNVTISSNGKKIHIHASSETARCSVNIPATVEGKAGTFAISMNALRDATKNRKELEIEYSKTMCKIKSGSYKCDLATVDALEMEPVEEEKTKTIEFDAEQAVWIRSAVSTVALKPTALLSSFMPVGLKLTPKGAFVACYDVNHMAFLNSDEVKGDTELKLPLDTLTAVLDAFGNTAFALKIGKASVAVANKLVKVNLSLPQEEENELTLVEVIETAKAAKKAEGQALVVPKEDVLSFLENSRAIATKERSEVKVAVEDGKLRLEVTTVQGSAKAQIKVKSKNCKFAIDFEQFDEAVRKGGENVEMKLVKDEFLAVHLKNSTVILSLNQE